MERCLVPSEWRGLWSDVTVWHHNNFLANGTGNMRCRRCVNAGVFSFVVYIRPKKKLLALIYRFYEDLGEIFLSSIQTVPPLIFSQKSINTSNEFLFWLSLHLFLSNKSYVLNELTDILLYEYEIYETSLDLWSDIIDMEYPFPHLCRLLLALFLQWRRPLVSRGSLDQQNNIFGHISVKNGPISCEKPLAAENGL